MAWLLFGSSARKTAGHVNMTAVESGATSLVIVGVNKTQLGSAISGGGDVNGDGIADVIIGAWQENVGAFGAGAVYVLFGRADTFITLDMNNWVTGMVGFRIFGPPIVNLAVGGVVSLAKDVNGDGVDDIILGVQVKK